MRVHIIFFWTVWKFADMMLLLPLNYSVCVSPKTRIFSYITTAQWSKSIDWQGYNTILYIENLIWMLPVAYSVFYGKRNLGSYITFSCHVSSVSFNLEQFLRLYHNKKSLFQNGRFNITISSIRADYKNVYDFIEPTNKWFAKSYHPILTKMLNKRKIKFPKHLQIIIRSKHYIPQWNYISSKNTHGQQTQEKDHWSLRKCKSKSRDTTSMAIIKKKKKNLKRK